MMYNPPSVKSSVTIKENPSVCFPKGSLIKNCLRCETLENRRNFLKVSKVSLSI